MATHRSRWSTSSHGECADTTPAELSVLIAQRDACQAACGRLFAWRCRLDRIGGFVASHVVTTVMTLALLVAVPLWLA